MKLVTAVIHPETFEDVKAALENLPTGRPVFTECSSRHPPRRGVYRGVAYTIDLGPMIRVEVVCDLFDAENVARVVATAGAHGRVDGIVWVSETDLIVPVPARAAPSPSSAG